MRIHNPTITGSFTISGSNLNIDSSGNITTLGSLTAAEYTVSSSVTALTITTASGSVNFGDTQDDNHRFTGYLEVTGSSIALGDGNNNVVLGKNQNFDVTSQYSTFIGYQAAGGNEGTGLGGTNITVVGWGAGQDMQQNPHRTTLIGALAGANLNVGLDNTFVGSDAGFTLTQADRNVFIGSAAGYQTVDVDNAVIIGYQAGYSNMTSAADGTIASGYQAGYSITSGAENTIIGYYAGRYNQTGGGNI